jgi:hypothetical protein
VVGGLAARGLRAPAASCASATASPERSMPSAESSDSRPGPASTTAKIAAISVRLYS